MENSFALVIFTLLALQSPAISADECSREVIRLTFGSVRGDIPSNTTGYRGPSRNTCDPEHVQLLCSDVDYPNDIFCDAGMLRQHPAWDDGTSVTGIHVKYSHGTVEGSYCTLMFNAEGGNFAFVGAQCSSVVEDERVPPFRVSNATAFEIIKFPGLNKNQRCIKKVYHFGGAVKRVMVESGVGKSQEMVKFDLTSFLCENTLPTFIGGREAEKSVFSNDGRRYRPK